MLVGLLHRLHQLAFTDVLGIEAVTENHNVHSVSFACSLKGNQFIFSIFIVVLTDGKTGFIVFAVELEYHLTTTGCSVLRFLGKG